MDTLRTRIEQLENPTRTGYLIGGFLSDTLSVEEKRELDSWVLASEKNMQLFEDATSDEQVSEFISWLANRNVERNLQEAKAKLHFRQKRKVARRWIYAVAAAAAILLVILTWTPERDRKQEGISESHQGQDILPGHETAVLTIGNAGSIPLTGQQDTSMGNINIRNGTIHYKGESGNEYHELRVPRKGFFQLFLSDGTRVWINNESTIRFPASFPSDKREVEVTGETFFEVAKDDGRPFVVKAGNKEIEVTGTAFNVNEFDGQLTLVEGRVNVKLQGKTYKLSPGQQINEKGLIVKIPVEPVRSWTKNQFRFSNQTIREIGARLERWYDVEFEYTEEVDFHFNATIDRNVSLARILELLEATGHVKFEVENRNVKVKR